MQRYKEFSIFANKKTQDIESKHITKYRQPITSNQITTIDVLVLFPLYRNTSVSGKTASTINRARLICNFMMAAQRTFRSKWPTGGERGRWRRINNKSMVSNNLAQTQSQLRENHAFCPTAVGPSSELCRSWYGEVSERRAGRTEGLRNWIVHDVISISMA